MTVIDRRDVAIVLRDRFGYSSLTKWQDKVVGKLLDGRSVLAVLPTGAGKSLCYQLTSQLLPGITVVISPLVALMKDQCDAMAAKGIAAARIDASVDAATERKQWLALRNGQTKLLYVAPERCFNERFDATIATLSISLLAIDEAHCISQWGHQFRPDYRRLPELMTRWKIPQSLALTATASKPVIAEIRSDLKIDRVDVVQASVVRPNLRLRCIDVSRRSKDDALLESLRSSKTSPTIVYVTRRRDAERVAEMLIDHRHSAAAYHAGIDREIRDDVQRDFLAGKTRIVVATVAFGMGVDKSNVRQVIHYHLSSSIEAYTQEIGRGGRDGKPAVCQTLLDPRDRVAIENLSFSDTPTTASLKQLIATLAGQPDTFAISHTKLAWECNLSASVVAGMLVEMSREGSMEMLTARYDTYRIAVRQTSSAMIDRSDETERESVRAIVDSLIKGKRGHRIHLAVTSRRSGIDRVTLLRTMDEMAARGWVDLKVGDLMHSYRWIERPKSFARWADRFQKRQVKSIQSQSKRIDALLSILRCNECLVSSVAKHFGQTKRKACGRCSACTGEGPLSVETAVSAKIGSSATRYWRSALATHPESLSDPIDAAKFLCGLYTPETTRRKLHKLDGFGCCEDVPFAVVMAELGCAD